VVDSLKCPENHCFSYDYQGSHFSQTAGFEFSNKGKYHCYWRDHDDHAMGFGDEALNSFDHNFAAKVNVLALDLIEI
jgi:hypothetical protein